MTALQANQLVDLRVKQIAKFYAGRLGGLVSFAVKSGAISNSFGRGVDQSRVQRYNCAYEPRIGRSRPGSD